MDGEARSEKEQAQTRPLKLLDKRVLLASKMRPRERSELRAEKYHVKTPLSKK